MPALSVHRSSLREPCRGPRVWDLAQNSSSMGCRVFMLSPAPWPGLLRRARGAGVQSPGCACAREEHPVPSGHVSPLKSGLPRVTLHGPHLFSGGPALSSSRLDPPPWANEGTDDRHIQNPSQGPAALLLPDPEHRRMLLGQDGGSCPCRGCRDGSCDTQKRVIS